MQITGWHVDFSDYFVFSLFREVIWATTKPTKPKTNVKLVPVVLELFFSGSLEGAYMRHLI